MIIVKIKGGLGNQLFQYSIGRYLSLKLSAKLKLNILGYNNERAGIFKLGYFEIPKIDTDISPLLIESFKYYKEQHFHYDEGVMRIEGNTYLDGYWQSEQYFSSIGAILLKDLRVRENHVARVVQKAKEINNIESVAVHIRRGDFLANHFIDNFGVLPIEYYLNAIQLLKEKLSKPVFYFFSDDIEWVRENLCIHDDHLLVSKNITQNSIEDFYLMTKCNNHIIANSTFSWWSAWLCRNNQKLVIGPRKWFNNTAPNTKDVLPQSWIKC